MTRSPVTLDRLASFDPQNGDLVVIIETPRNSRSKYAYEPESGTFALRYVLPEDWSFPVDFGFIPSTLGEDGDPLDVIILLDESLAVGTKVSARLIGAIKAKERMPGEDWIRNDRLVAVAIHAHTHEGKRTLSDIEATFLRQLETFFTDVARRHGKEFKAKALLEAGDADALVRRGMRNFARGHT